jgi:2-dehydro-3-deoxygalactonokinase
MSGPLIGIDWGTTNCRTFLIENGVVLRRAQDTRGAISLTTGDYPRILATLRAQFGDLPVMITGMAGSRIGWREVPYVETPAGLDAIARGVTHIDSRTLIVPGVADLRQDRVDVMRGEETLILGGLASGALAQDALVCQPGTHCKWADVSDGRITRFITSMTGELFALLRGHGLLANQLAAAVEVGTAYCEGVAEGARRDLGASLFGIRSNGLLGRRDDAEAASFASGLLIGADVAARLADHPGVPVALIANQSLGELYQVAIELLGGSASQIEVDHVFVAGITALRNMIR